MVSTAPILVCLSVQGYITGLDFARSMIAAVDVRHVDCYLDRANNLSADLADSKVRSFANCPLESWCQISGSLISKVNPSGVANHLSRTSIETQRFVCCSS